MFKKMTIMAALFVIMAISNSFAQETFTNPQAKVDITLPAGWTYETTDESLLVYSPEKDIAIHFTPIHVDDLDAALAEVDKMLDKEVPGLVLAANVDKGQLNGLNAIWLSGTAPDVEVLFGLIDTPAPNYTLFAGVWGNKSLIEKNVDAVVKIMHSIAPSK